MNGEKERRVNVDLSFLGRGKYEAMLVRDVTNDAATVKVEQQPANRADLLQIELRPGGGFVARFTRATGV